MYIGYFYSYSSINLLIYIFSLLFLFVLIFYQIQRNDSFFMIYKWLFFFLLFPKKTIVPNLDSILTNAVGLSDNLLIATNFSFYDIINFMILISISYKLIYSSNIKFTILSKKLFLMFSTVFISGIIGTIYYNLFLSKYLSTNYLDEFHYLINIYEGLIFSIIIFFSINHREHFKTIFRLFLLTLFITCTEFYLARYTNLLPDVIKYFALDYRGGFRSFMHSGSINTGMILFYGFLGFLGQLSNKKYLLCFIPFIALTVFSTYERSTMLLIAVSTTVFLFFKLRPYLSFNAVSTLLVILFLSLNILQSVSFSGINNAINRTLNVNDVDGSVIKAEGWFSFSSSNDRKGARKRAMDVFYFSPFFGSGPGNLEILMASSMVPMKANFFKMGDSEFQFYNDIATAYHPTDPHNYYIRMISEYGIFGIIFLLTLFYLLLKNTLRTKQIINSNVIGYCGIFSILAYGFFQTGPISYPLIILFLKMITFNTKSIE